KPLYRFYDTALGYHFYTASEDERISLQSTRPELRYEGVAYRVFGSATVPWQGVGGSATAASGASSSEPFLQFSPGLDPTERTGLSQGRELFLARWTPAPGARATLDGLGPPFNADACSACHVENGLAPNLLGGGGIGRGMLFRLGNRSGAVSSVYGGQLQDRATAGLPEGSVTWRNLDSGAIEFALMVLGTPLENGMSLSPRLAPRLVGMGLLDMVPESQILEFADAEDSDGNGISGRAHRLPDGSLGRFGWKAIHGDLRHQIAGALHQDMGLTTSLNAAENCTPHEPVCVTEANGGTPEVADESLENLTRFSTALSVPARRHDDLARFQRGAKLFTETGCAQCHRPVLRTGTSTAFPSLSNQLIYPYTDLLLHDMGSQLDEGVREVNAEAGEWRTPPLWGIGLVAQGANARFLHDGRATTIDQAVRWHGGEALSVRNRYVALDEATRETLLYFINGL
ncbi:MAG TPA: di-heme oxidoredictase family protein, partial [Hydrogenophaga sp.]